ncbi:MAG: hypothetical protein E8D46_04595 [Nitrospira sp.]|nr:MAG: hypothetical protein E8D46_04595 [Nitrospira sp.]
MQEAVSTVTAGSLVLTLCLGILLVVLPRRYALVPMLIGGCYMTLGQFLLVGGMHFYLLRILILFGVVRLVVRQEVLNIKLNVFDKLLIAWVVVHSFLYVLFDGSHVSFNERLGAAYNSLGIYFLIRALIWDFDDVVHTVKMFAVIIIPLAVLFAVEYLTGKNPFSVFGGVPEFAMIREGRLRCQGPFQHPILAGTFGATALPLFVGLWVYSTRDRLLAGGAILSATIIVVASSSSGPLLAFVVSVVGLLCWRARANMRAIRWGIVIFVLAAHAFMKAPVWFLIARLSDLTGGGGWYRSALIDAFITHFDEWWLYGTGYTAHWMPTGLSIDPTKTDIVNQFVAEGVNGGLLELSLFIWLIVHCFRTTGEAVRSEVRYSFPEQFMIWSLGCTILSHVVSFLSVSYFDQIVIFWFMIIAMIVALLHGSKENLPENEVRDTQGSVQYTTS